jgi:hypothetical protein
MTNSSLPETNATSIMNRGQEPGGQMTFFEHLSELRKRILNSLYAVAIGAMVGFYLAQRFIGFITQPMLEALKETGKVEIVPGAEPENLAALGDGAFYSSFILHVLKGDVLLTFGIQPPPAHFMDLLKKGGPQAAAILSSEVLAQEKLLAAKALARL